MTTKTIRVLLKRSDVFTEALCTVEVEQRTMDQPGGITDLDILEVDDMPFEELDLEDQFDIGMLVGDAIDRGDFEVEEDYNSLDDW